MDDSGAKLIRHTISAENTQIYISTALRGRLTSEIITDILNQGFSEDVAERSANVLMMPANDSEESEADSDEEEIGPGLIVSAPDTTLVKPARRTEEPTKLEAEALLASYMQRGAMAMKNATQTGVGSGDSRSKFNVTIMPTDGGDDGAFDDDSRSPVGMMPSSDEV